VINFIPLPGEDIKGLKGLLLTPELGSTAFIPSSGILEPMPHDPAIELLAECLSSLQEKFVGLPSLPQSDSSSDMRAVLDLATARMSDNYPYFHPLYAGQMLKPPHPIARAAYGMAMWLNPNNHARDGGRASSQMEIEAVREIGAMFNWDRHLGHLTSGGTFANLEALWIAGQLAPGKRILASEQAHYTHSRISNVLKLDFASIPADSKGRMNLKLLEKELRKGDVGTVVVTLGTTATGSVDPLDKILELRNRYGFRVHVDAAYGGYFRLIARLIDPEARQAFEATSQADSIVIDPHKHGLQPYGCGCVLFRDPSVGRLYRHDSPYTYFTSEELHLGEISLECSRAGAAAVALWCTQKLLPLIPDGKFAADLQKSRDAARLFYRFIENDSRFLAAFSPELDIVICSVKSVSPEESSRLASAIFRRAAQLDLHLALAQLPVSFFPAGTWPDCGEVGDAKVTCLRSVLMKPEHLEWIETILQKFDQAAQESC
jgi:tyrosine decarboxylase / aspartate 1-decarboxylase